MEFEMKTRLKISYLWAAVLSPLVSPEDQIRAVICMTVKHKLGTREKEKFWI